ncbi:Beta-galactosidase GanA [Paenibacillus sp. UNCCL117]|uniref:beta-galactosidase n=1 Tax=unclassified Paenibacillus TaxID=185978 RepID=UPI000891E8BC|nr:MULTISPECIES: beta-galactosidase [unclassified Paenibacillus]SDE26834.1 Beta-galactosidase GanA [Paenibacillus sp. cl123]SFW62710.1 Beta-galactosidase GanA [Paenibacillus sp. UNCCL117]
MTDRKGIRIGSQLFINKEDTAEQIRNWVCLMAENGLSVIRLFMVWEQLEPKEGQWVFDTYDACFDQALLSGLTVVPTLMSGSPPGWMRLTDSMQELAELDDPSFKKAAARYIGTVVRRYAAHPALDSWILWNEPTRSAGSGRYGRQAYIRYLQNKYRDIDGYNAISYKQFDSFEQLELEGGSEGTAATMPFRSFAEQLEQTRFAVENLSKHLHFIREQIRKYDARHPVHVNPHNLQRELQSMGQSIWSEAEQVDFLGCSAHPMWHSLRFPERRWGQSVAFFADLMKSATLHPEGLFWVTELQGGTTLYSGNHPYTPSRETIKQWIWEGIGSGARAVVFWCFNSRSSGYEAGEWALLNRLGEPSQRLLAAKETAVMLQRHDNLFAKAAPAAPRVLILYSEASCALGAVEGQGNNRLNPRNTNMYMDALAGAWLMCSDLSLPVLFRNEKRFVGEPIPQSVEIVILPNTIVLGRAEIAKLEDFARLGGLVIADGLCGMKEADGRLSGESIEAVDALFGASVLEIETDDEGLQMTTLNGEIISGWFYRLPLGLRSEAAFVARFLNGAPSVAQRKLENGSLVRVGTSLFQAYFARPVEGLLRFFETLMNSHASFRARGVRLTNGGAGLRLQRLTHPEGEVVLLFNKGARAKASIIPGASGQLTNMNTSESVDVNDGNEMILIDVPENGTELYFFRWRRLLP